MIAFQRLSFCLLNSLRSTTAPTTRQTTRRRSFVDRPLTQNCRANPTKAGFSTTNHGTTAPSAVSGHQHTRRTALPVLFLPIEAARTNNPLKTNGKLMPMQPTWKHKSKTRNKRILISKLNSHLSSPISWQSTNKEFAASLFFLRVFLLFLVDC